MATNLIPQISNGLPCPKSVNYSKVVGPSPAIATMKYYAYDFDNSSQPSLGDEISIQIDNSIFYGFLFKKTEDIDDYDGDLMHTFTLVDWRDRLGDYFIFGAFNVMEADGRIWHLLPKLWETQEKIYITKELEQYNFDDIQNVGDDLTSSNISIVAKKNLLSSATILNMICSEAETRLGIPVIWTSNATVLNILKRTKPMNIDWQDGSTLLEAIESVLSKSNMTFCVSILGQIDIVLKGYPNWPFFVDFLNRVYTMCSLNGIQSNRGEEINEEGRKVLIIGERNKYQYVMPCRPDWPVDLWDIGFCYNEWQLSSKLKGLGLTPFSKLKEMPLAYQDTANWSSGDDGFGKGAWSGKSTRNEMQIHEYISKICFHTYRLDCSTWINNFKMVADELDEGTDSSQFYDSGVPPDELYFGEFGGLNRYTLKPTNTYDNNSKTWNGLEALNTYTWNSVSGWTTYHSFWPVSQRLITDSNAQAVAFTTSRKLVPGKQKPIEEQLMFVPTRNFSLDVEEKLDDSTNRSTYIIRATFNDIKFFLRDLDSWDDGYFYEPDHILVMLSFDREIYSYTKGDDTGIKSRTKKHTVKNLYRAFVNGLEKFVLAENFQKDLKEAGVVTVVTPVLAGIIAEKIADMLLFHVAVNKTGSITFEDQAGTECDGIVESVSVSFDDVAGVTEVVNFSNTVDFDKDIASPFVLRVSKPLKTDAVLDRERMDAIARELTQSLGSGRRGFDINDIMKDFGGSEVWDKLGVIYGGNFLKQTKANVIINAIGSWVSAAQDLVIGNTSP